LHFFFAAAARFLAFLHFFLASRAEGPDRTWAPADAVAASNPSASSATASLLRTLSVETEAMSPR
jgi:hypothetical protein